jgi:NAD(P)-dependent dehydrogenase (short-subunit alcohol dehydrogenase family)
VATRWRLGSAVLATGRWPWAQAVALGASRVCHLARLDRQYVSCPVMDIRGAAAIVSGGASGLGEATVRRLATAGAHVTIVDFNAERGDALAAELGGAGRAVKFVKCDVTDSEQVAEAVAAAAEDGPLRIAINCAGTGTAVRTIGKDGTPHLRSEWDRVLNINLLGTMLCLTHEASLMSRTEPLADGQRGVIVNTASVAAFDGQVGQLAYSASKGGVVAMTLPAARDLSVVGIRVCTIAPGLMDTPLLGMLPAEAKKALGESVVYPKRLGHPDEFAKMAMAIVDNDYLNGEVIRLDGAIRMQPK